MTFDYNLESLVVTLHLVLITGITSSIFAGMSLEIICGKTRADSNDVIVTFDKKDGS